VTVRQCAVFGCSNGDNYAATVDEKYIRGLQKNDNLIRQNTDLPNKATFERYGLPK